MTPFHYKGLTNEKFYDYYTKEVLADLQAEDNNLFN